MVAVGPRQLLKRSFDITKKRMSCHPGNKKLMKMADTLACCCCHLTKTYAKSREMIFIITSTHTSSIAIELEGKKIVSSYSQQ